ncbi:MAG: hypothetical protein HC902_02635 [Calothrix sp. SM1_5_4]|nr:hypothetical protein [Calothrix sp. SM1_5_4]
MSFYAKTSSGEHEILTGLYETLGDISTRAEEIVIRPDRNIDYNAIVNKGIHIKKITSASAEYTFSSQSENHLSHIELCPDDCKNFVAEKVKSFFTKVSDYDSSRKIVLGISGGGDSNTLIESFLASGFVQREQIVAVMMLGVPDWDKGLPRAKEICGRHGIEFRQVTSEQVNVLLGRRTNSDWIIDFEKHYPDSDLEVLGTLGIRRSLTYVAQQVNAQAVVVGLNLEDLLAESLLRMAQGTLPLPFPIREIDQMHFWYPLYECPKKILDGCHPKYSLQNYMDRYPSKLQARALCYYMAQTIHAATPGFEFDLIRGLEKLSASNRDFAMFDPDFGFSTLGQVSLGGRTRWRRFLNGDPT